jgi:hypothetical protein
MRHPSLRSISLVLVTGLGLQARPAGAQDIWTEADKAVRRLAPVSFTQAPTRVIEALENLRCLVPQSAGDTMPHNVIKGSFSKPGQTDWAALCSRAHASTIVIIWGAPSSCPSEMETREDRTFLVKGTDGKIRFERTIQPISAKRIKALYDRYGGDTPPPLNHEGISDVFNREGVVRYCYEGKWRELTGEQGS